jgi:hypothetical protein
MELFLQILHSEQSQPNDKAEALYYIAQISFDEGNYSAAMEDWQRLVREHPKSDKAIGLKDRLTQLREVLSKVTDASVSSPIASSYLRNGDFWSEADKKLFTIDGSWLPRVELASEWYDRVISEFAGTYAAELAYQRKLFTLLEWYKYESNIDLRISKYGKYLNAVLKTFEQFEAAFPASSYLQGFRYQIAQTYWLNDDWSNARKWLDRIIAVGGGQPSFYTETAKARLSKLEHK